jgi:alpha-amylase
LGSSNSNEEIINDSASAASQFKVINVTHHDGHPFSTGTTSTTGKYIGESRRRGYDASFYWDVPAGKLVEYFKHKSNCMVQCRNRFYLLTASIKSTKRSFLYGYDPTDYFDFGNYNQNGTTETRFGSKTELSLISKAHSENIQVYADIVLNHNSGGQLKTTLIQELKPTQTLPV